MPYRTTRAFREQLDVVALLGQLEQARTSAGTAAVQGRRRLAAREQRRADQLSELLERALERPSLRRLETADLLPPVRELLASGAPPQAATESGPAAVADRRLLTALACAGAVAWILTFAAAAAGGISSRPTLIAPDVVALALTLIAVLVGLRSG